MKIVLATPTYPPEIGSAASYIREFIERLAPNNNIATIAYTDNPASIGESKLVRVSKRLPLPLRLFIFFAKTLGEARSVDIIYAQNAVAAGLPAALASSFTLVPLVIKFMGDEALQRKLTGGNAQIIKKVQRFVLRRAKKVIAPSEQLANTLVHTYAIPKNKIHVIPNPPEKIPMIPFDIESKPHGLFFNAVGATTTEIRDIHAAFVVIQKVIPDVTLTVIGNFEAHNDSRIIVRKNVSRAERSYLEQNSNILILPSNASQEALLQSVSAGITFAFPSSQVQEIEGIHSISSSENLVDQIQAIWNNGETIIAEQNKTKAAAQAYTWENYLPRLLSVFESVRPKPANKF